MSPRNIILALAVLAGASLTWTALETPSLLTRIACFGGAIVMVALVEVAFAVLHRRVMS